MKVYLIRLVILLCSCSGVCRTFETRCLDNVAQICNDGRRWQDIADCSSVTPPGWRCAPSDDPEVGHTCVRGVAQ